MPSDKIRPQKTTQDRQFYRSKNGLVVRRQESGRTEMTANRYKNSFGKNKIIVKFVQLYVRTQTSYRIG